MRKSLFFLCVLVSSMGVIGQVNLNSSTGRVKDINTDFSFSLTDKQYDRILLQTGWLSGIGDYMSIKHGGGNTEAGTYGFRISDAKGFDFGKNDFGTSFFKIMTNGNVGIGTTNPTQKFEIYNPTAFNTDMENQNQDHISLVSNDPGNGSFFGGITWKSAGRRRAAIAATREHVDSDYVGLAFFTQGTDGPGPIDESMRITRYGKVGIGTTTPDAKLHVEGQAKVGKSGVLTLDWTNETNWGGSSNKWAGYIGFNSSRNDEDPKDFYVGKNKYTSKGVFEGSNYGFRWLYRNHNNYDSDGQHQLTEYMRLNNNGDLGIGTTNPDAKLTVNGNIHTKEVKVDLAIPAPDYVFLKDYDLKTISEVEAYIQDKGHLPNIPSAIEMEVNGVELGNMNMKLLEKIEELTLYTIAQEKQLKTQQEKNNQLEARLEKLEKLITKE